MCRTFQLIYVIFICLNSYIIGVLSNCESLPKREGVEVICRASENSRTIVDCYQSNVSVGTIARYQCKKPFYLPINVQFEETSHTLTCNSRGKWSGGFAKFQSFSCIFNCGVTNLGSHTGFVIGGTETTQSEWPWHATIYVRPRSDLPFKYVCGGSLVKPFGKGFIIVTAAHCLAARRGIARNINDVQVGLGIEESSFDDIQQHSPDSLVFDVKAIALHESYGGHNSDYQSDIALIRLNGPIKVKPHILPVCLSKSRGKVEIGDVGHVVGFGLFKLGSDATSVKPRRASFPVVSPDKCFEWRNRKLLPQEYCAGTEEYQNSCNGDSGGGMVFNGTDEQGTKRFYLQGVVSHGRVNVNNAKEACDTYSVYTKVDRYVDWIHDTAEKLYDDDETNEEKLPVLENSPISTTFKPPPTTTEQVVTRRPQRPAYQDPDVEVISDIPVSPKGAKDYEIAAVERHNHYRRLHGAKDIRLNPKLSSHAQMYAEMQIREGTFVNKNEGGIDVNKNIYKFIGRTLNGPEASRKAIDSWYNDIANYNWYNPSPSTFSQVVWKKTTEIGIGIASNRSGNEQIVVVSYSPAGNIIGQFHENVSPKL